jgi:hypothetical protein
MLRWFRRFIWLGLIGGIGAAAYTIWQRRQVEQPSAEWSPVDAAPLRLVSDEPRRPTTTHTPVSDDPPVDEKPVASVLAAAGPASSTWVTPIDGACPSGYPIKGNSNSRIYHVPGGRFYERTVPERCYASATDAEADGYRAAKS